MATLKLRDRDAVVTSEGLIFRVFGNSHPSQAYICDVEYASSRVFKSENPKAYRNNETEVFYKFYEDEGLKFVKKHYPQHMVFHEMLQTNVAGVNHSNIVEVRRPNEKLEEIVNEEPQDKLTAALHSALEFALNHSGLSAKDFGVFGSLLHGFHHPQFSDLDFIVYGRKNLKKLRETLQELYKSERSLFTNEFKTDEAVKEKSWRFHNFTAEEFVWHQRRKLIYAMFENGKSGRVIKTEFEPVKDWKEIVNEYDSAARIVQKGWVRLVARVVDDDDAPFIHSVYRIEPLRVLEGNREAEEAVRIVSFMEEFRMQASKDEKIYVEGNLEEVTSSKGSFYQIALTYCPRYYEQALKVTP